MFTMSIVSIIPVNLFYCSNTYSLEPVCYVDLLVNTWPAAGTLTKVGLPCFKLCPKTLGKGRGGGGCINFTHSNL